MDMDSLVKVFENVEFRKIRTVVIDGNLWFAGKDIAEALDGNVRQGIASHVDDDDKVVPPGFKK
jgi:anti-repressor protein